MIFLKNKLFYFTKSRKSAYQTGSDMSFLDLEDTEYDLYDATTSFLWHLKSKIKKKKIHVIFIILWNIRKGDVLFYTYKRAPIVEWVSF